MADAYKKNSITLPGAVAMGTGVMIGAGIFALTGQIAELAGPLFPLSFVVGAFVTAFSAYTYINQHYLTHTLATMLIGLLVAACASRLYGWQREKAVLSGDNRTDEPRAAF